MFPNLACIMRLLSSTRQRARDLQAPGGHLQVVLEGRLQVVAVELFSRQLVGPVVGQPGRVQLLQLRASPQAGLAPKICSSQTVP